MYKIKTVSAQMGYRFQNMSFNEDGSINANLQVGTLNPVPSVNDSEPPTVNFNPIATSGHYLHAHEAEAVLGDLQPDESGSLRGVLEARIEAFLRAKGALTF